MSVIQPRPSALKHPDQMGPPLTTPGRKYDGRPERWVSEKGEAFDFAQRIHTAEFLAAGGRMGRHIRAHDWQASPLGLPELWPTECQTMLRVVLSSSQPLMLVWGRCRTLFYNDAAVDLVGAQHPVALGRDAASVLDQWDPSSDFMERVFAGETVDLAEIAIHASPKTLGRPAYFHISGVPVQTGRGEVGGMVISGIDITERVRTQAYQKLLLDLADRLQDADSAADVTKVVAENLGRVLGANRVGFGHVVDDQLLQVDHDWTDSSVRSLVGQNRLAGFGDALLARLRSGRIAATHDVSREYSSPQAVAAFRKIDVRGLLMLPLLQGGRLSKVLFVHTTSPRRWSEDEIAFVAEVARRMQASDERRQADVRRRAEETDFRRLADVMPMMTWATDATGRGIFLNRRYRASLGDQNCTGHPDRWLELIVPGERQLLKDALAEALSGQAPFYVEAHALGPSGEKLRLRFEGAPRIEDGIFLGHVGFVADVTEAYAAAALLESRVADRTAELRQAKEALHQAQKMEAIGQLTGGIAHDFNNLLQGISGSLDLIQNRIAQGRLAAVGPFLKSAAASASKAAALTHRLLAFARRQPIDPRPMQPNDLIVDMKSLLRQTCGEGVKLAFELDSGLWAALCDSNQLENALLNLVINARDAMPQGGSLTIGTDCFRQDDVIGAVPDLPAGDFVRISVQDTGLGMSADVLSRAFEPFFTTKPPGQGTGLGLSMIYGFARQSGGTARMTSRVGEGTAVELYLPRHDGEVLPAGVAAKLEEALPRRVSPGEVILVVEDDPVVRQVVVETLVEAGYAVLQAGDGAAGRRLIQKLSRFDLLVTDIDLGSTDGRELAELVKLRQPATKVLFMTGYAETATQSQGFLEPGMEMITKPFALDVLAQRVHAMLANG